MAELSHEAVAELLGHHGLGGDAFDPATIAPDLSAAMDSAATLDELLGAEPIDDPTAFSPRWV